MESITSRHDSGPERTFVGGVGFDRTAVFEVARHRPRGPGDHRLRSAYQGLPAGGDKVAYRSVGAWIFTRSTSTHGEQQWLVDGRNDLHTECRTAANDSTDARRLVWIEFQVRPLGQQAGDRRVVERIGQACQIGDAAAVGCAKDFKAVHADRIAEPLELDFYTIGCFSDDICLCQHRSGEIRIYKGDATENRERAWVSVLIDDLSVVTNIDAVLRGEGVVHPDTRIRDAVALGLGD